MASSGSKRMRGPIAGPTCYPRLQNLLSAAEAIPRRQSGANPRMLEEEGAMRAGCGKPACPVRGRRAGVVIVPPSPLLYCLSGEFCILAEADDADDAVDERKARKVRRVRFLSQKSRWPDSESRRISACSASGIELPGKSRRNRKVRPEVQKFGPVGINRRIV